MKTDEKNPYGEQVMRCSSLQKFPLYPQGIKELRDTLQVVARTPAEAAQVIDRAMERDTCPTPREIRAIANKLFIPESRPPANCSTCDDTGLVRIPGQPLPTWLAGIRKAYVLCSCEAGEAIDV